MAKMLYSATMSLDGFITGPGGDMSWLTEYLGPNPAVDELIGRIGALLVGNRSFRGDDPYKDTPQLERLSQSKGVSAFDAHRGQVGVAAPPAGDRPHRGGQ